MVFLLLLPIRLCDILHPHLVLNSSKFHNADDNQYEQQDLDAFYNNLGESLDLFRHHFFLLLFNCFVWLTLAREILSVKVLLLGAIATLKVLEPALIANTDVERGVFVAIRATGGRLSILSCISRIFALRCSLTKNRSIKLTNAFIYLSIPLIRMLPLHQPITLHNRLALISFQPIIFLLPKVHDLAGGLAVRDVVLGAAQGLGHGHGW